MDIRFLGIGVFLCVQLYCTFGRVNLGETINNDCLRAAHCYLIMGDIARINPAEKNDPTPYYEQSRAFINNVKEYKKTKTESIMANCKKKHDDCKPLKTLIKHFKFPAKKPAKGCTYHAYTYMFFWCQNIPTWPPDISKAIFGSNLNCARFTPYCADYSEFEAYHIRSGKKLTDFPPDWKTKQTDYTVYDDSLEEDPARRKENDTDVWYDA